MSLIHSAILMKALRDQPKRDGYNKRIFIREAIAIGVLGLLLYGCLFVSFVL